MEKEFVSYEQAVALKELGFDEPCLSYYEGESFSNHISLVEYVTDDYFIPAPLKQQASRFFREKYGLNSFIELLTNGYYLSIETIGKEIYCDEFNTYEEAEEACLDKLIEIAKK